MSQSVTVQPGFASAALPVAPYSVVTVNPTSSCAVVYTEDSLVAINNNTATWSAWPSGTVTALTQNMANSQMFVMMSANTAPATIRISDPNPKQFELDPSPWVGVPSPFIGQLMAPDGSATAPSYAFSNATSGGFYNASGSIEVATQGTERASFGGSAFGLVASYQLGWSTGANASGTKDVTLARVGGGLQITASTMGFYGQNVTSRPAGISTISASSGALASTLAMVLNSLGLINCTSVAG